MYLFYIVIFVLLCGCCASLAFGRDLRASYAASVSVLSASIIGFCFCFFVPAGEASLGGTLPLPLPIGAIKFSLDRLSCAFLLPVFILSALGAVLLPSRLKALHKQGTGPHAGLHSFFFCLLVLGMVLTLSASDGIFFLISWELMSLSPFFLLSVGKHEGNKSRAGWTYLVAAHLGVLPLLLLFADLSIQAGSSDFAGLLAFTGYSHVGLLFSLALLGFGLKIGLFPMHVWMPAIYPAAPGHVALVMSGAMVNLGLYGLLRVMLLLGFTENWWGYALMAAGGLTGILGVLFAMAQKDIKKALAFSSSENMGIVCLALGAAILAGNEGAHAATMLFLSGGMLHMWNHSLFKALYFLCASSVSQCTGTTLLNNLGGLQKRLPVTGLCTAIASGAIAGAPPFNGFVGELLLYLGFVVGALSLKGSFVALIFWCGLFLLGGIAGFSLLCFARVYGISFLGAARSPEGLAAEPEKALWKAAMLFMAFLCLGAAIFAPLLYSFWEPILIQLITGLNLPVTASAELCANLYSGLGHISIAIGVIVLICLLMAMLRHFFISRTSPEKGLTWDCGYRLPSARMQYTSGSFVQFPASVMRFFLRSKINTSGLTAKDNFFPRSAKSEFESPDWAALLWELGPFALVRRVAKRAKVFQQGLVNLYILYILIALLVALVWALGWS